MLSIFEFLFKSFDLGSFQNLFQDLCSSLILLIVDMRVSDLLDQCVLILKLVLGCDCKFSFGCIQNWTYIFSSPTDLWNVLVIVPVFFIAPVTINTMIGFKSVPHA